MCVNEQNYYYGQLGPMPLGTLGRLHNMPQRWGLGYLSSIFHWIIVEGCFKRHQLTDSSSLPCTMDHAPAAWESPQGESQLFNRPSVRRRIRRERANSSWVGLLFSDNVWYGCRFPQTVFGAHGFLITWLWNTHLLHSNELYKPKLLSSPGEPYARM